MGYGRNFSMGSRRSCVHKNAELIYAKPAVSSGIVRRGTEIRQMIFGRYRILFNIEGDVVNVLHVRGAFGGEA